jgi:hypothetical protein
LVVVNHDFDHNDTYVELPPEKPVPQVKVEEVKTVSSVVGRGVLWSKVVM